MLDSGTASEIELFTEWVRRGAPFPAGEKKSDAAKHRGIDLETGRKHWSFQPLREQPLPAVKNAAWGERRRVRPRSRHR